MCSHTLTSAFIDIMGSFKRFIEFKIPVYCVILSLYVLITYCHRDFDAVAYILLTGERGSGKTTALDIFRRLSPSTPRLSSMLSSAAFYRAINKHPELIIFDEVHESRSESWHKIETVLLNGYRADGVVLLADKKDATSLLEYDVYGPKLLANIEGLKNKAILSRIINIPMYKREKPGERLLFTRDGQLLKQKKRGLKNSLPMRLSIRK